MHLLTTQISLLLICLNFLNVHSRPKLPAPEDPAKKVIDESDDIKQQKERKRRYDDDDDDDDDDEEEKDDAGNSDPDDEGDDDYGNDERKGNVVGYGRGKAYHDIKRYKAKLKHRSNLKSYHEVETDEDVSDVGERGLDRFNDNDDDDETAEEAEKEDHKRSVKQEATVSDLKEKQEANTEGYREEGEVTIVEQPGTDKNDDDDDDDDDDYDNDDDDDDEEKSTTQKVTIETTTTTTAPGIIQDEIITPIYTIQPAPQSTQEEIKPPIAS